MSDLESEKTEEVSKTDADKSEHGQETENEQNSDNKQNEPEIESIDKPIKPDEVKDKKADKKRKRDSKPQGEAKAKKEEENPDFKYIIRVANTNLDGNMLIPNALTGIRGIGIRLGTAITDRLQFPRNKKLGDLTDAEVEQLVAIMERMNDEFPDWMMNRQKDFDTGESLHIISSDIQRSLRDDLNRLKKIRCYRGIRHEQGQKVRGQRTRSNGRTGMTVGVQRKKVQQQQTAKK